MFIFKTKPLLRLLFIFNYVLCVVLLFTIAEADIVEIMIALALLIFASYISIVKAKLLVSKRVDSVSDSNFDFINILLFIGILYEIMKYLSDK